jgi:hypothetical protein
MTVRAARRLGRLALAAACAPLLAASPAPAQSPGGAPAPGPAAGEGPIRDWRRMPIAREETELRERGAGVAGPARRERDQLRELDELSRQRAPGAPLPAPAVGDGRR